MKIYLAGPMRGIPEFNFPAFTAAAAKLRSEGHEVFSPHEADQKAVGFDFSKKYQTGDEHELAADLGFTLRHALNTDLNFITLEAEAIALLPGWQNSKGVAAELATARALGLRIIELEQ